MPRPNVAGGTLRKLHCSLETGDLGLSLDVDRGQEEAACSAIVANTRD